MSTTMQMETTVELLNGALVEVTVEALVTPEDNTHLRPGDPDRTPFWFEDPEYTHNGDEAIKCFGQVRLPGERIPDHWISEDEEEKVEEMFREHTPTGEEIEEEREIARADMERDRRKDERIER